jgi:hypothetical protein
VIVWDFRAGRRRRNPKAFVPSLFLQKKRKSRNEEWNQKESRIRLSSDEDFWQKGREKSQLDDSGDCFWWLKSRVEGTTSKRVPKKSV